MPFAITIETLQRDSGWSWTQCKDFHHIVKSAIREAGLACLRQTWTQLDHVVRDLIKSKVIEGLRRQSFPLPNGAHAFGYFDRIVMWKFGQARRAFQLAKRTFRFENRASSIQNRTLVPRMLEDAPAEPMFTLSPPVSTNAPSTAPHRARTTHARQRYNQRPTRSSRFTAVPERGSVMPMSIKTSVPTLSRNVDRTLAGIDSTRVTGIRDLSNTTPCHSDRRTSMLAAESIVSTSLHSSSTPPTAITNTVPADFDLSWVNLPCDEARHAATCPNRTTSTPTADSTTPITLQTSTDCSISNANGASAGLHPTWSEFARTESNRTPTGSHSVASITPMALKISSAVPQIPYNSAPGRLESAWPFDSGDIAPLEIGSSWTPPIGIRHAPVGVDVPFDNFIGGDEAAHTTTKTTTAHARQVTPTQTDSATEASAPRYHQQSSSPASVSPEPEPAQDQWLLQQGLSSETLGRLSSADDNYWDMGAGGDFFSSDALDTFGDFQSPLFGV